MISVSLMVSQVMGGSRLIQQILILDKSLQGGRGVNQISQGGSLGRFCQSQPSVVEGARHYERSGGNLYAWKEIAARSR